MTEKKEHWLFSRKNILAAIVFCTTSLPIGIWTAYKHFDEKHQQSMAENRKFAVSIAAIDLVYDSLRRIVYETDAHRALLLRAEDSGDIPVPGKDIYSSIVYEVFDNQVQTYKPNWRRQLIDGDYVSMLSEVARNGFKINIVDEMKPSILKNIYESQGTSQSHVYSIHQEPAYFFYCSIVFKKPEKLTPIETDKIRAEVNRMRVIFQTNRSHLQAFKL